MTYTVAPGDTLSKIAGKFLGDPALYKELATLNKIANPNLISVGQVLQIPDSSPVAAAVVKSASPLIPTPLLPVPITPAAPVVTSTSVAAPAGQSMLQQLLSNKKLLIALAVGAGVFFFFQTQSKRGKTVLG